MSPVDQALNLVRQLAARPALVFDPYALIEALENLEEVARRSAHADVRRFAAVLSNCKRLPMTPRLGDFVTQALGDEVEKEVTRMMVKLYKPSVQPFPWATSWQRPSLRSSPYPRMSNAQPPGSKCFACRRTGHFARNCPQNPKR